MYETEANGRSGSAQEIPAEVRQSFAESRPKILSRTLLPWSEHCTECVWPTCYTTCDLYEPREDMRCRRFVDGMVRIDLADQNLSSEELPSSNAYVLKIRFKQWGKLWAPGRLHLHSMEEADKLEASDLKIGSALFQISLPGAMKRAASGKRYSYKKRVAQRGESDTDLTGSFLLECYNPNSEEIGLSLTIRSAKPDSKIPFQQLIHLKPGFNRERIPVTDIARLLDLSFPFSIDMIPNEVPDGTALYFGMMDFVREVPTAQPATEKTKGSDAALNSAKALDGAKLEGAKKEKTVKCIVWDLDNTLWDGILVEDGPEKIRLKPGIAEVIKELDRRGILHSIASKNNHEDAMQALRNFGLEEYFLSPQISWNPKGLGVQAVAKELNIGSNTLLFIDDSDFELQEVQATCPDVRVLKADQYLTLPVMNACQVPVTEEAMTRRKMYQVEKARESVAAGFGEDYFAFLKQCQITVQLRPLSEANLERVHELTQRTNQMNFSGNRYSRELLKEILSAGHLDTYVISCADRFGTYGVVGFAMVDPREPRMTDLMFSCRVQSKRVEHAIVGYLIRKHSAASGHAFLANYRKTDRNAPSGAVFADIGMQETGVTDGVTTLVFPLDQTPPNEGIIEIVEVAPAQETADLALKS